MEDDNELIFRRNEDMSVIINVGKGGGAESDLGTGKRSGPSGLFFSQENKRYQTKREEELSMPSYVIPEKCDGCKALDKTACQYICPNDLIVLNKDLMKAYNCEPRNVLGSATTASRFAPHKRLKCAAMRISFPLGASVTPMRSTDSIMWTVKFRKRTLKAVQVPHSYDAGRFRRSRWRMEHRFGRPLEPMPLYRAGIKRTTRRFRDYKEVT